MQGEIGFVGLGHMGTAMAANLAAAGYRVIAYARRPDRMGNLIALGLEPTTDITNLFDCDVLFGHEDLGIDGRSAHDSQRPRRRICAPCAPLNLADRPLPVDACRFRHLPLFLSLGKPEPWQEIS